MDGKSSGDTKPKSAKALIWSAIGTLALVLGLIASVKDLWHWPLVPSQTEQTAWHAVAFGKPEACDQLKTIGDGYYADRAERLRAHPTRIQTTERRPWDGYTQLRDAPYAPDKASAETKAMTIFRAKVEGECATLAKNALLPGTLKSIDYGNPPPAPECPPLLNACRVSAEVTCVIDQPREVCGTPADADTTILGVKLF